MLCFRVVETKKSQILKYGEKKPSVDFRNLFVVHYVNIVDERFVNSLSHIQLLKEFIVLLFLSVEVIHY